MCRLPSAGHMREAVWLLVYGHSLFPWPCAARKSITGAHAEFPQTGRACFCSRIESTDIRNEAQKSTGSPNEESREIFHHAGVEQLSLPSAA